MPVFAHKSARVLRPHGAGRRASAGFGILEVMVSATILILIIATSLTVLQTGMRAVDTARNMTLAGQISQSALEGMRLLNWQQILALTPYSNITVADVISSGSSTTLDATLNSVAGRFTCTRTVTDPKANMRVITITVSWRGNDGRAHSVSSQARYGKNGLNDYIYISH